MEKPIKINKIVLAISFIILFGAVSSAKASVFHSIPYDWEYFDNGSDSNSANDLDYDNWGDDENTGSVPLGFSVAIGGAAYDHFDMDSNGYVELLSGAQSPVNYGYGYIDDLTGTMSSSSTYLLAAYDDLSSYYYGYFGYTLESNRAVFYYNEETYDDEDYEYLNNFEIILTDNGNVQWNFNYADYAGWDYDLYSGLYFGNTKTLHKLYNDYIPENESWIYNNNVVPEPSSILLLSLGLLGAGAFKKRKK